MNIERIQSGIETNGFAIRERVLSQETVDALVEALGRINLNESASKRGGIRNLLEVSPEIRELACSPTVRVLVESVLGPGAFPVRGILFDKVAESNWKVPWHQDVTIAVQKRIEVEGFGPWTMKANVLHVQPPTSVLEQMISIRLHLDNCREDNGALRVIPGSHLKDRIPEREISSVCANAHEHICIVKQGGALLMRPLLLHASSSSRLPGHRRVIHLDFAAVQLPCGMRWAFEVPPTEMR